MLVAVDGDLRLTPKPPIGTSARRLWEPDKTVCDWSMIAPADIDFEI
ncbi:hypothetical protein [Mesorhizobium sp.]|nr:hypothetical protein [Mesorhizobium sp.]